MRQDHEGKEESQLQVFSDPDLPPLIISENKIQNQKNNARTSNKKKRFIENYSLKITTLKFS